MRKAVFLTSQKGHKKSDKKAQKGVKRVVKSSSQWVRPALSSEGLSVKRNSFYNNQNPFPTETSM
jgi:hypothetical protein